MVCTRPCRYHDFGVDLNATWELPNPNPSLLPPRKGHPEDGYLLAFTQVDHNSSGITCTQSGNSIGRRNMPVNYTTWGTERVAFAISDGGHAPCDRTGGLFYAIFGCSLAIGFIHVDRR
jgi:hypothetical protein